MKNVVRFARDINFGRQMVTVLVGYSGRIIIIHWMRKSTETTTTTTMTTGRERNGIICGIADVSIY